MSAAMRIGSLNAGDRQRVVELLRRTAVFRDEEITVALELFDEAVAERVGDSSDDYEFIGAFAGDALTGFACYGPTPDADRTYDLYWLAVDPGAQRAGTGSFLVGAVEERLRERRGRLLVADTSSRSDYEPTRAFYERRGFGAAARVRDFYAPGDDRIIYTKRLDS